MPSVPEKEKKVRETVKTRRVSLMFGKKEQVKMKESDRDENVLMHKLTLMMI